jgi:hypothetical protein
MSTDVAWAAGLFEGEGSVCYLPKCRALRLQMKMTDEDVLRRFTEIVGTLSIPNPTHRNRPARAMNSVPNRTALGSKPVWQWHMDSVRSVQNVLRQFWPYLGERRRAQAALALARYCEAPIRRECFAGRGQ